MPHTKYSDPCLIPVFQDACMNLSKAKVVSLFLYICTKTTIKTLNFSI